MALKEVNDYVTRFGLDSILLLKSESQGFNDFKWIWQNELCYSPLRTWDSAEELLLQKSHCWMGDFEYLKEAFNLPWLWKFWNEDAESGIVLKGKFTLSKNWLMSLR